MMQTLVMPCLSIPGAARSLAFGMPGGAEWIILLVLGLLIFGRRLPEVGRSLGRGIVEFKRGIRGIEDDIDDASSEEKLPETSTAKLAEPAPSEATEVRTVTETTVGGESNKPYTPREEPGKDD